MLDYLQPEILMTGTNFVIVNKPVGFTVHNEEPSLQIWAKNTLGKSEVHFPLRLDKETSGVIPILFDGRDIEIFRKSCLEKSYYALLRGQLKDTKGTWTVPITDKAEGRKNPLGKSLERVPAHTDFEVLQQNKYFTLVECKLGSGRQHQIRKHAAHAGHAIVGDSRYGDSKYNERIYSIYKHSRLFLHCQLLRFCLDGQEYSISTGCPTEFRELTKVKVDQVSGS